MFGGAIKLGDYQMKYAILIITQSSKISASLLIWVYEKLSKYRTLSSNP
jgi:hypothetical protein